MGQTFHPAFNTIARVSIFGGIFILAALGWAVSEVNRSPYITQISVAREQPVMFSHKHHVDGLGIDCRFCHNAVETSASAGMPSTSVCMKCHSVMWNDSPMLEPVRESFKTGEPIEWVRVHDLPDHAYFNHSLHLSKGIGCVSCHGQVDQMPLMWRENTLHMGWCLDCHNNPEKHVRPKDEVFNMNWQPPVGNKDFQKELIKKHNIKSITNCSACHR